MAAPLFVVFAVEVHIRSVWSRLKQRIDAVESETRADGGLRPVPLGAPVAGNAWEDYRQAFLLAPTAEALNALWAEENPNLEPAHEALLRLRAGAHRRLSRYEGPRDEAFDHDTLGAVFRTLRLAMLDIERQRRGDRRRLALERLILTQQVLRDLDRNTPVHYWQLLWQIDDELFEQWRATLSWVNLPAEESLALGESLRILEEGLPPLRDELRNHVIEEGRRARRREWRMQPHGPDRLPTDGGFLWSERLTLADAFHRHDSAFKDAQDWLDLSWSEARARCLDLERSLRSDTNPYVRAFPPLVEFYSRLALRKRTHLRLARACLILLAGRPLPQLADPFGDYLRHQPGEALDRVSSVGVNGVWGGGDDLDIAFKR